MYCMIVSCCIICLRAQFTQDFLIRIDLLKKSGPFFHMSPVLCYRVNPAFNKEIFVDFIAAQIKTLSFLAYIIRIYQVGNSYLCITIKSVLYNLYKVKLF